MENPLRSVNNALVKVFQVCLLSVLALWSSVQQAVAQSDEPSVQNLKTNMSAAAKDMAEREKHAEFMNYIYMCVGFAIVVAVAWGTTVAAKKRSRRQAEERQRYHMRQAELKKHGHHPHHAHGHVHHGAVKARR